MRNSTISAIAREYIDESCSLDIDAVLVLCTWAFLHVIIFVPWTALLVFFMRKNVTAQRASRTTSARGGLYSTIIVFYHYTEPKFRNVIIELGNKVKQHAGFSPPLLVPCLCRRLDDCRAYFISLRLGHHCRRER